MQAEVEAGARPRSEGKREANVFQRLRSKWRGSGADVGELNEAAAAASQNARGKHRESMFVLNRCFKTILWLITARLIIHNPFNPTH